MMSSQSRNEIWAVRAEICEIAIWQGVDLPTLGLPNMSSQIRAGICEIAFEEGGSCAKTWSVKCWALSIVSCQRQESMKSLLDGEVDMPGPGLPNDKLSE